MTAPHLSLRPVPAQPRGLVLVLHGGRSTSTVPVRPWQGAVVRMGPIAAALHRAGAPDGLVVARLRFAVRGWNGAQRSPVADATWALDELARRFPDAPIALVGHSMGGRTALYAAGHERVRAVVALAPWIEAEDPLEPIRDRRLLIAHGTADRMTSPVASADYARRAQALARSVSYVSVRGERHAMLRRPRVWNELSAGFVRATLLDGPAERGLVNAAGGDAPSDPLGDTLARALAGAPSLVV